MNRKTIVLISLGLIVALVMTMVGCNMTTTETTVPPVNNPGNGSGNNGGDGQSANPTGTTGSEGVGANGQTIPVVVKHMPADFPTLSPGEIEAYESAYAIPLPPPADYTGGPTPTLPAGAIVPMMYHFPGTIPPNATANPYSADDLGPINWLWGGNPVPYPMNNLTLFSSDCSAPMNVTSFSVAVTAVNPTVFNYTWVAMNLYKDANGNWVQENLVAGAAHLATFTSPSTQIFPQDVPFNLPCGQFTIAFWFDFGAGAPDGKAGGFSGEGLTIQGNATPTPTPTLIFHYFPTLIVPFLTPIKLLPLPTATYTPTTVVHIIVNPTLIHIVPTIPKILPLPTDTPTPTPVPPIRKLCSTNLTERACVAAGCTWNLLTKTCH